MLVGKLILYLFDEKMREVLQLELWKEMDPLRGRHIFSECRLKKGCALTTLLILQFCQ